MGHSKRTPSVMANKAFYFPKGGGKLLGGQGQAVNEFRKAVDEKNTYEVVRIVVPHVLFYLPNGPSKKPLYYAFSLAYKLLKESEDHSFEDEIENKGIRVVVNGGWDIIEKELTRRNVNSSLMNLTERAYKRTMTEIINERVDVI